MTIPIVDREVEALIPEVVLDMVKARAEVLSVLPDHGRGGRGAYAVVPSPGMEG
jgi:hypothetical protein